MKRLIHLALLLTLAAHASAAIVGLNVQMHAGAFDAAGKAFTKELGVQSIRLGYGHGDYATGVKWAAQNGMGVLFMLGYGSGCDVTEVAGRQCYADRSAGLAKTYGDKVRYYEVWNEWNGGLGLGKWPACLPTCRDGVMYTDLLCRTYKAVKAVRPNAIIVGGVTANMDMVFITKILDAGAGACMDMLSVHPYIYHSKSHPTFAVAYDAPAQIAVGKFIEAITAAEDLARQRAGRTIPILVSEEGRLDNGSAASEQITGNYLAALYNRAPSIPFLEGIWWFALKDASEGAYGLLRSNNTKKSGFAAYIEAVRR